jgi:N-acetylglucosamine kinase-like BadF-type ATPase
MSFFLAVDAGGTKTDLLLADETRELARVRTGTIKRMRTDEKTAGENLGSALQQLTAYTGIAMDQISRTCVGTAGESVPLVADWLRQEFGARVGGELLLLGDVEIALDAAFHGEAGVLILAGTGSNVAGRTTEGLITTAGGWGPALADQGSGYSIGHEALKALFLSLDEQRPTLLLPAVLEFWQLSSIELLIAHANALPAPDFSRLTGLVLRCAEQGDEVAKEVLEKQGKDLAYLVRLVIHRVQEKSNQANWIPTLAFAGSIMESVRPVREALIADVQRELPKVKLLPGVVDPLAGAVWRVRHGNGWKRESSYAQA